MSTRQKLALFYRTVLMAHTSKISKAILTVLLSSAVIAISNQAFAQEGTWATKAPMLMARGAVAGSIIGSNLYVVGGGNRGGAFYSTLEVYDPTTNIWTFLAPMPTAREAAAAAAINGKLYVVGGSRYPIPLETLEVYDPTTNTWTSKASMPAARSHIGAAAINGRLYVVGGHIHYGPTLDTLEVYDPTTDTWTSLAPMPTARYEPAVSVINGKLYVAGGMSAFGFPVDTLEVYDPVTNTWTIKAPMPTARVAARAAAINGRLYVVGGENVYGIPWATLEVYDPATNTWTSLAPMPTARGWAAAAAINGIFYVAGGWSGWRSLDTLETFTPVTAAPPIPVEIDIKPGSYPNSINPKSKGNIPVAILSSSTFDAPSQVDKTSLTFGRTGDEESLAFCNPSGEDVNGDGLLDLVCHFETEKTGFQHGDTQGVLKGKTMDGTPIKGTDYVKIVPK